MVGCHLSEGEKLPAYEIWQPVGNITQTSEACTFQMKPQRVAVRKGKVGGRAREGRVYDALKWSKAQYPFILIKRQNSHCLFVLSTSSSHYRLTNLFSVCLPFFLRKKKKSVSISKQKLALQGKMYLWLTLLSNMAVASGDDGNTTGRQYKGWKLKSCLCLLYIQWWVSKSVQCWI